MLRSYGSQLSSMFGRTCSSRAGCGGLLCFKTMQPSGALGTPSSTMAPQSKPPAYLRLRPWPIATTAALRYVVIRPSSSWNRGYPPVQASAPRARDIARTHALHAPADDKALRESRFEILGLPVGSIAGVFGSILGVGGGVFMVPMMTCKPMELEARYASATSLVAVLGTGLVSAVCYGFYGQVDPIGALVISSAAVVTAPAGARATMRISNSALKRLMGIFLIIVAPSIFLRDSLMQSLPKTNPTTCDGKTADGAQEEESESTPFERAKAWLKAQPGLMALPPAQQVPYVLTLVSAGGVAGFLSGLLGIGGGLIVTPIMALFSGMSQHAVVGTSMLAMIAPSSVSLYTHHTLGNVRWPVGRMLLLGSACGAAVGVQVAQMCEDKTMKRIFAVGMFFLGVKSARG